MDLLVEKLDGSRYYLSQYKVLITDFEESAPSVTRNSKQLDQHNGNIDFGGWHKDKTINITGYYRADDMDDEEMLREKLYALLSDTKGYYITQLKTTPSVAMERPGETSGDYYDKLSDYPSHKRFLVYTEAPEMELVGNVNGTLLYKLTAEFKTMKLPYGESMPQDLDVKPNVPYCFSDVGLGGDPSSQGTPGKPGTDGKIPYLHTAYSWSADGTDRFMTVYPRENLVDRTKTMPGYVAWSDGSVTQPSAVTKELITDYLPVDSGQVMYIQQRVTVENAGGDSYGWWGVGYYDENKTFISRPSGVSKTVQDGTEVYFGFKLTTPDNAHFMRVSWRNYNGSKIKVEVGEEPTVYTTAPSEDMPNAYPSYLGTYTDYTAEDSTDPSKYTWALIKVEDGNDGLSGYNKWYFDTYYNTDNLFIPYAGTVPCNQLEQGFEVEFVAKQAASSLSFKIDDTELTYSGAVASGDVFMFSGFSYTQNGLSIVSKTNKAYFILQPDKPNRITCNVPGTVRIIGFQNLYA